MNHIEIGKKYFSRWYSKPNRSVTVKALFEDKIVYSWDDKKDYDDNKFVTASVASFIEEFNRTEKELAIDRISANIEDAKRSIRMNQGLLVDLEKQLQTLKES